jgi:hypothetical protein
LADLGGLLPDDDGKRRAGLRALDDARLFAENLLHVGREILGGALDRLRLVGRD